MFEVSFSQASREVEFFPWRKLNSFLLLVSALIRLVQWFVWASFRVRFVLSFCLFFLWWARLKVKSEVVTQSCLTLCNPVDSVHGIFQARVLQWVAISFSRGSSQPRNQIQVPCIAGRVWAFFHFHFLWLSLHFLWLWLSLSELQGNPSHALRL